MKREQKRGILRDAPLVFLIFDVLDVLSLMRDNTECNVLNIGSI